MAMDINDYSTRLSQARENYHDKAKELQDGFNRQTSEMENSHKAKQKAQQESYIESRANFEDSTRAQQDVQTKKTQEQVARLEDNFRNEISDKRSEFEDQSIKKQRDFSNRLQDISENYYTSSKRADSAAAENVNRVKTQLEDRIESNNDEARRNLVDIQDKSRDSFQTFQQGINDEKKQLLRAHSTQYNEAVQDNNVRHADIVNKAQKNLQESNQVHAHELKNFQAANQQSKNEFLKNQKIATEQMLHGFQGRLNEIDLKNETVLNRQLDDDKRNSRIKEQNFNKQIDSERRRVHNVLKGSSGDSGATQEVNIAKKSFDNRIDKLQEVMQDERYKSQINKEKMIMENQDANRQVANDYNKYLEKVQDNNSEYITQMTEKDRQEKDVIIDRYTDELKRTKDGLQTQNVDEQKKSHHEMTNMRSELGRQLNLLQERNVETISEIQKESAKEKTNAIEMAKRDLNNSREELRDSNNFQKQKIIDSYTKKIDALENDKKNLVTMYENQIVNFKKKTMEELAHKGQIDEQRRMLDTRNNRRAMEGKIREANLAITNVRTEFDKKLAEAKHHNELHLNKLVERYEDEIKRLTVDNSKMLERKLGESREQYERLSENSEVEKEQIRTMYELKLQSLRQSNEQNREIRRAQLARGGSDDSSGQT
jgi:hypothetical protein